MSDSDLHWSNTIDVDGEALNLWGASEIRHSLFVPELQRMLFGMLDTERIFPPERPSSSHVAYLYQDWSRGLIFLLSDLANRLS